MIINVFGFIIDWMITRSWQRIFLLLFLPAALLMAVLVMGVWGALLNKEDLAKEYLLIGERELRDADEDWAFDLSFLSQDKQAQGSVDSTGENSVHDKSQVSRFTAAMFQRSRQLQQDNLRTTFVIGAILGQQGALPNAIATMKMIAPDNRVGFAPAHAWIANLMLMQNPVPEEQKQVLQHHLDAGLKWEQAPASLLRASTKLALEDSDYATALDFFIRLAEKDPAYRGELFRFAIQVGNRRVAEQTAEQLSPELKERDFEGKITAVELTDLAEIQFFRENYDAAQEVLEKGLKSPRLSESDARLLRRTLSDFFRLRFDKSLKIKDNSWTADIQLLDQAMRADPTNPLVAEQVAKLARIGGDNPPDELIAKLKEFLAEGRATPVTHAWMAEAFILRNEYSKAIEHLSTVVQRMPDAAHAHNNLAYAISITEPERMDEALEHAKAAIALNSQVADFHDTLGSILLKQGRTRDAVTEIEIAIELDPRRSEFHERAAEVYKLLGDEQTAQSHLKVAEKLTAPAAVPSNVPATAPEVEDSKL